MIHALILGTTFLLLMTAPVDKATAVESLSTAELQSHCAHFREDPDGKDGIFCIRYIQGFIDGAVATDAKVTDNVANEYERSESFTERATRIRLGQRLERFGPSYYADFCLGEPVPLVAVVIEVVTALQSPEFVRSNPLAREAVYLTLREHYPCE